MNCFSTLLIPCLLVMGFISAGSACHCKANSWDGWSGCTSSCFGTRERSRSYRPNNGFCRLFKKCRRRDTEHSGCNEHCHNGGHRYGSSCVCQTSYIGRCCRTKVNHCDSHPCQNGAHCTDRQDTFQCTCRSGWRGRNCEIDINECASQPCQNGAQCTDLLNDYRCTCQFGWSGRHCENVYVFCGTPDSIANGTVSYTSTFYKATVTYRCNTHFNMTGGYDVRTCQIDTSWSGLKPSCVYVNHCSSQPCQNGAQCTDLLGDYKCTCQSGWSGKNCENDIQPPVMSGCLADRTVYATSHTMHVNWSEPTFEDPLGNDIQVTANYQSPEFTFPWGDFTVQYVATKPNNGLQTECKFQIGVRPTPCGETNIPFNGARLCNGWRTDYGIFCLVACKSSYTIDTSFYSYETFHVCGASGNWIPSGPLPDCEIHMSDVEDITADQPNYDGFSFESTCDDPMTKQALKELYIRKLSSDFSFKEFCSNYPDECLPENVVVDCGSRKSGDVS